MNTPLDDWRDNPPAQKAFSAFWNSKEGQLFQRVLEYTARPNPVAVPGIGTEGAVQAGVMYHKISGMYEILDQLPKLLPAYIAEEKSKLAAAAKVATPRTLHKDKSTLPK